MGLLTSFVIQTVQPQFPPLALGAAIPWDLGAPMGKQAHVLSAQVWNHPTSQMRKLCCRSGKTLLRAGPFHIWNLPV